MISARQAAESEIAKALNPLEPAEAMAALIEMQAVILAEQGIVPKSAAFEHFVARHIALLSERVHGMRQGMIAAAH